jgi:effector-binding domain-containing protein
MSDIAVETRSVPAQRVATVTRTAPGFGSEHIGPVVGPMFPEVVERLLAAGVAFGPAVAIYAQDADGVRISAGFELEGDEEAVDGLDVEVLPALGRAVVTTHHGSMAMIDRSWTALMDAATAQGETLAGPCREVYLTPGDVPQEQWVTRLIQPVGLHRPTRASAPRRCCRSGP